MGNREELIERTIKWLSTLAELTDDEGDAGAYLQTVSLIQSMCLALSEARKERPIVTFDEDGGMYLNWTDLMIVEIDREGLGYAVLHDGKYRAGLHDAQKDWKAATDDIQRILRSRSHPEGEGNE